MPAPSRVGQMVSALRCRRQDVTDEKKEHSGPEERHVGSQLMRRAGQNMVDAKDLVIHQAFDEVE